ncbi:MAG: hypothetical protein HZA49_06320 [Planctomycetes bacterium]|nr:hypothetical protein [Planctomycetota bacterium]
MKIKHYIAFCLIMFLAFNVINLEVSGAGGRPAPAPRPAAPKPAPAPKPYNPPQKPPSSNNPGTGGSTGSGSSSGTAADAPEILELNWQADTLSSAINTASHEKKVVFVYFYFNKDKEDFPANYDAKLQKLSSEKYIFAKILVVTDKDKNGRVFISDGNASFFEKHKLAHSAIGVAFDPYGNLMDKLAPPMSAPKIVPFMENAEKKYESILTDLDNRYERADKMFSELESTPEKDKELRKGKLIPEATKTLLSIVNSIYEGYQSVEKANTKLGELNEDGRAEYLKLMKEYALLDKELRDPKSVTPEMEKLMKIYKGLPVEQEIKDAMKDVKEKNIPEKAVKELEKPAAPPASKDESEDDHQGHGETTPPEEQHGPDNK